VRRYGDRGSHHRFLLSRTREHRKLRVGASIAERVIACGSAADTAGGAASIAARLRRRAEVAEWQTRRSQKPWNRKVRVGSTPTFGTKLNLILATCHMFPRVSDRRLLTLCSPFTDYCGSREARKRGQSVITRQNL
jgi:hypothetical protein